MSFFKNLFGGNKPEKKPEPPQNPKPDIDQLLAGTNLNNSIIMLDSYLSKVSDYGYKMDVLNEQQRIFILNQNLEREVNNGGFNQFYFNSAGDYAKETVAALEAIGAHKTAAIVKQANAQFPGGEIPNDQVDRQELMESFEETANPIWDGLDRKFYEYEDDLNSLNMAFVRKHKTAFA